jgi:hypothetical protein
MPWVPHVDPPQMGEQTELGRQRRELIEFDLCV